MYSLSHFRFTTLSNMMNMMTIMMMMMMIHKDDDVGK
jgi:hypothetical protein